MRRSWKLPRGLALGSLLALLVALFAAQARATAAGGAGPTSTTPSSAVDLAFAVVNDPYLLLYVLAPAAVIAGAGICAHHGAPESLLRYGSAWVFVRKEIRRGLGAGAAIAVLTTAVGLVVGFDLGFRSGWSPAAAYDDYTKGLVEPFARRGISPVGAIALQGLALALWAGLTRAVFAVLVSRGSTRVAYLCATTAVAIAPILCFHLWQGAISTSPINLLLVFHALAGGWAPWSAPIMVCLLIVVIIAAVRFGRGLSAFRWTGVHLHLLLIAAGAGLLAHRGMPHTLNDVIRSINYGAGPESISLTHWSYTSIVWLGGAYLLTVRWASLFTGRVYPVLVRYGSAKPLLRGELVMSMRAALGVALWSFVVAVAYLLVAGDSGSLSFVVAYQHGVNGPLQMLAYSLLAGAAMVWTQRSEGGLVVLAACLVLSLFARYLGGWAPFGLASQGMVEAVPVWRITVVLVATCLVAASAILFASGRRPINIE